MSGVSKMRIRTDCLPSPSLSKRLWTIPYYPTSITAMNQRSAVTFLRRHAPNNTASNCAPYAFKPLSPSARAPQPTSSTFSASEPPPLTSPVYQLQNSINSNYSRTWWRTTSSMVIGSWFVRYSRRAFRCMTPLMWVWGVLLAISTCRVVRLSWRCRFMGWRGSLSSCRIICGRWMICSRIRKLLKSPMSSNSTARSSNCITSQKRLTSTSPHHVKF